MSRPELSVVIPAYNEAQRIGPTLHAVMAWLEASAIDAEVLVVDDGSHDDTVDVARRVPGVTVVETWPNRGKGHAVRVGMLHARGRLRLFMDADGAVPISELPKLHAEIVRGADVAIGSRRADGAAAHAKAPWYRRIWSRLTNKVVRATLTPGIRDTQCGFKLFRAEATQSLFERTSTDGWGFDLEVLGWAKKLHYRVAEVAVTYTDDPRSKIHPLRDAVRVIRQFVRIRRLLAAAPAVGR